MVDKIKCNLRSIRKMRSLTQVELSEITGISQRMIAHYENQDCQIPANNIIKLANALKVSTDEILGTKKISENMTYEESKIWKKVKKIINFSERDQQVVLQLISSLSTK